MHSCIVLPRLTALYVLLDSSAVHLAAPLSLHLFDHLTTLYRYHLKHHPAHFVRMTRLLVEAALQSPYPKALGSQTLQQGVPPRRPQLSERAVSQRFTGPRLN